MCLACEAVVRTNVSGAGAVWRESEATALPLPAALLKIVHAPLICPPASFFLQSIFVSIRIVL